MGIMDKILLINIPSYKQETLLRRVLLSLQDQTFKNFKVVILDDLSGVDFFPIIRDFDKLKIEIIKNNVNLGAMENIKQSVLRSDTKYTMSLHEDDYLAENYLENAVSILEKNEKIAFVSTYPKWIKKEDVYSRWRQEDNQHIEHNAQEFVRSIISNESIIFGSIIYRSGFLSENMWDYKKYNTFCDRVFLVEILKRNTAICAHIQSPGISVRDHSKDSQDLRSKDQKISHFIQVIKYYNKNLSEAKTLKDNYLILKTVTIGMLYYTNIIKIVKIITNKL